VRGGACACGLPRLLGALCAGAARLLPVTRCAPCDVAAPRALANTRYVSYPGGRSLQEIVPRLAKESKSPASAQGCPLATLPQLFKEAVAEKGDMPALLVRCGSTRPVNAKPARARALDVEQGPRCSERLCVCARTHAC